MDRGRVVHERQPREAHGLATREADPRGPRMDEQRRRLVQSRRDVEGLEC